MLSCTSSSRLAVSSPQSGLQAFRLEVLRNGELSINTGFNPSIGLTSVPTASSWACRTPAAKFQSLNRAYKRSDGSMARLLPAGLYSFQSLNRAYKRSDIALLVLLDQLMEVFQSLNRAYKRSDAAVFRRAPYRHYSFNPSIGLTSVPTMRACTR